MCLLVYLSGKMQKQKAFIDDDFDAWQSWCSHVFFVGSPPEWLIKTSSSLGRLTAHIAAKTKLPILIFPEGESRTWSRWSGGGFVGGFFNLGCVCHRNLHQQHVGHDVQEGKLWNRGHDLPGDNQGKSGGRDAAVTRERRALSSGLP